MSRTVLKSKIHNVFVTDANIKYEGSITIDSDWLRAADIWPFEQVHVLDVDNGKRFVTYAIAGIAGGNDTCVNGAAALLVDVGDRLIILAYETSDAPGTPKVVNPAKL
jgi:aspartate 1-decarboxylase